MYNVPLTLSVRIKHEHFLFQLNQACTRELSEETGLTFSPDNLNISTLGLWEVHVYEIIILCSVNSKVC